MQQNRKTVLFKLTRNKKTGELPRLSGVTVPLFSIYSEKSMGIGEFPDLKILIDWCNKSGLRIVQLLPLNDMGFDNSPYNSISSFALDPVYLNLKQIKNIGSQPLNYESYLSLDNFDKQKPKDKVDYSIKKHKIEYLRSIFSKISAELSFNLSDVQKAKPSKTRPDFSSNITGIKNFYKFVAENKYWIHHYVLFKVLKEVYQDRPWEDWDRVYKYLEFDLLDKVLEEHKEIIYFYYWIQWNAYLQLNEVKKYAEEKGVYIMGDIPLLVSRDSADVWQNQKYFKLNLSSGAPPDMYFSKGQRWGTPPFNRESLEEDNYTYIKERLKYTQNFYHLFRIDHFVGLFRIWTIDINTPVEYAGFYGKYDPEDSTKWEENGRKLLSVMLENTIMLPCAEDLGTVPECSYKVLNDFNLPGTDVQRWTKTKDRKYKFLSPRKYRKNSVAVLSTHDSATFVEWFYKEAGTIDNNLFNRLCIEKGICQEKLVQVKNELFINTPCFNEGIIESLIPDSQQIVPAQITEREYFTRRLKWKNNIDKVYKLISSFDLDYERIRDIIELYLNSFDEKKKFLYFIIFEDNPEKKEAVKNKNFKTEEEMLLHTLNTDFKVDVGFIKKVLLNICSASSFFSIQLLQDWLCLDEEFLAYSKHKSFRINLPGVVDDDNWTVKIPFSLEKLNKLHINRTIKNINRQTERI